MRCSAVIAAAGLSSRMHAFKPLLDLNGQSIIGNVIASLTGAGVDEIVVVAGYRADDLIRHLEKTDVRVVINPQYAVSGMLDSLKLGIRALTRPYDGIYLTPGDVPLVRPETIARLRCEGLPALRPVCKGHGGHPVYISAGYIPQILNYSGGNGLRGALQQIGCCDVGVEDTGVLLDADTPEDFARLRRKAVMGEEHL
ncbi:MAG: nucleotidyltransferase family protein [Clostridia bacterium]|nr:nucleotidyltransferase family protein [Clostridia bacterium]